jgi:hypothetical protein
MQYQDLVAKCVPVSLFFFYKTWGFPFILFQFWIRTKRTLESIAANPGLYTTEKLLILYLRVRHKLPVILKIVPRRRVC